jgi:hypothetical protein
MRLRAPTATCTGVSSPIIERGRPRLHVRTYPCHPHRVGWRLSDRRNRAECLPLVLVCGADLRSRAFRDSSRSARGGEQARGGQEQASEHPVRQSCPTSRELAKRHGTSRQTIMRIRDAAPPALENPTPRHGRGTRCRFVSTHQQYRNRMERRPRPLAGAGEVERSHQGFTLCPTCHNEPTYDRAVGGFPCHRRRTFTITAQGLPVEGRASFLKGSGGGR